MGIHNLISIVGLFALLGIAWLLSYHKSKFPFRTVVWGIGLQLVLAMVILGDPKEVSFVGMAILAGLISAYIVSGGESVSAPVVGKIAAIAVLSVGCSFLPGPALKGVAVVAGALAFFGGRFLPTEPKRMVSGLFIGLLAALPISMGISGANLFEMFKGKVATFLSLSNYGSRFIFGDLFPTGGFNFALMALPTIIFFGGFMAVLYYLGIMQVVILALSRFMRWTIGTSGAETLSCTANIFVGQTEAPLLIKPFLDKMTKSELLTIMCGGFATIAGGVLAAYIAMGVDPGHLIAASVMSAPAALVIGKIIFPETEHSETAGDVELPHIDSGDNVIEAATNGIIDGLKLAVNVAAMLIGFIALINVIDLGLEFVDGLIDGKLLGGLYYDYPQKADAAVQGEFAGYFPGSLRTLFGTALAPLAWLMGVPWADAGAVGNLLGIKITLNEFVAFFSLGEAIEAGSLSPRAQIISTYALCGFANFASIGIQIGGISAVAPSRKSDLAKVGLRAMFGGALASWTTATIAGILYTGA